MDQTSTADMLIQSASGFPDSGTETSDGVLKLFVSQILQYYQNEFAFIPSLWGDAKSVDEIWVPLRVEDKTKVFLDGDRLDHSQMQSRLKLHRTSVGLIKGNPGSGKTTLVKKIAYDWAVEYDKSDANLFQLVLAVPLRSIGPFDDLVQMSIGYFLDALQIGKRLRLSDSDKVHLATAVAELGKDLLIILDGLDEFNNFSNSPFKDIFAPKFDQKLSACNLTPPIVFHKILITSRPYALEQINENFFPLRFQICSLDEDDLDDFAKRHCLTEKAIGQVNNYLRHNKHLVTEVPLILSFICYLADLHITEIPSNLTILYERLVEQMLKRELKRGNLSATVDIKRWKDSTLVRSTGALAYMGCTSNKLEFNCDMIEQHCVMQDSIICGLLIQKFDFVRDCLMVEFSHRSIQDFFAALYCYQSLSEINCQMEIVSLMECLTNAEGQFGRFLCGIYSKENKLSQLVEHIHNGLAHTNISPIIIINAVNNSFPECTQDEQLLFGQMIFKFVSQTDDILANIWQNECWPGGLLQVHIHEQFAVGLGLSHLSRWNWAMAPAKQPRSAVVVRHDGRISKPLSDQFSTIKLFIGRFSASRGNSLVVYLNSLPPIHSVALRFGYDYCVTFCLQYCHEATNCLLRYCRIQFDLASLRSDRFDAVESADTSYVHVEVAGFCNVGRRKFTRMNTTVKRSASQTELICALIKLAREAYKE